MAVFQVQAHPAMPLVSLIPKEAFQGQALPDYLTFAMATIGAVLAPQPSVDHQQLWTRANALIGLALEIDNRNARRLDLINAVRLV
jgi:hypothetical protein